MRFISGKQSLPRVKNLLSDFIAVSGVQSFTSPFGFGALRMLMIRGFFEEIRQCFCEHYIYVAEGVVSLLFDDERLDLKTGDALHIYPGQTHRLLCPEGQKARILLLNAGNAWSSRRLAPWEYAQACELLKENRLPVDDWLDKSVHKYGLFHHNALIATGSLQYLDRDVMLRSLAVAQGKREQGIGRHMCSFLETVVRQKSKKPIWLLTATAVDFFKKQGYRIVPRETATEGIRRSLEYTTLCPQTAALMLKETY